MLEMTYGYTVEGVDDPLIHLTDEAAVESFRYGGPGATLCDILPIREALPPFPAYEAKLKRNTQVKYWPTWMPFSFYQRHAAYTRTVVEKLFTWPLNWTEERIVPQSSLPSLVSPKLTFPDRRMEPHNRLWPEVFSRQLKRAGRYRGKPSIMTM